MLVKAGTEGKQIVFLFSDNQIKDESFVEDINMILNTGDVPNIFPADEKAEIIDKMQLIARTQVRTCIYMLYLYMYTYVYMMPIFIIIHVHVHVRYPDGNNLFPLLLLLFVKLLYNYF